MAKGFQRTLGMPQHKFVRFFSTDSMIVYVIIGVVGFAAGAGGILWAVCMFIRR